MKDNRHWDRESVEVCCQVTYVDGFQSPARASIVNMSPGGLMLASDQGFFPNQRISITLEDECDTLLFECSDILNGIVRWSLSSSMTGDRRYHIGVALEQELPRRVKLTEQ